jgi:hypothetical protein
MNLQKHTDCEMSPHQTQHGEKHVLWRNRQAVLSKKHLTAAFLSIQGWGELVTEDQFSDTGIKDKLTH